MEGSSLPSPTGGFGEVLTHYCECPRCLEFCYSPFEDVVETFLCTQFFQTEDILRYSRPNFPGQLGSFWGLFRLESFFPALRPLG